MSVAKRLAEATESAAILLANLAACDQEKTPELGRAVIEHIVEAASARVLLDMLQQQHKTQRAAALDVLGDSLCGDCIAYNGGGQVLEREAADAVAVTDAVAATSESLAPGAVEMHYAKLFDDWADRAAECPEGSPGDPETVCGVLVHEIHAEVSKLNPIGIAEQLYEAIGCLHAEDFDDAVMHLKDLADTERKAARGEKVEACFKLFLLVWDGDELGDLGKTDLRRGVELQGLVAIDAGIAWATTDHLATDERPSRPPWIQELFLGIKISQKQRASR